MEGCPPRRGQGGRGSLSYLRDGTRGKEHDEEDDDKNNHADEDDHLHILPPELPSHLLRCGLEVLGLLGIRQNHPVPPAAGMSIPRPTRHTSKHLSAALRQQTAK